MNPIVSRLAVGAATSAAAVLAKRAAEFGWEQVTGDPPPTAADATDDRGLRDLIIWAAVLAVSVTIARKLASSTTDRLASD